MSTVTDATRPNIRIEIPNIAQTNQQEPSEEVMEVDAEENEEGEISDDNMIEQISENSNQETEKPEYSSRNAIFTTGINIFDKKEQEKLQERARRFALKPEEIRSFSDQDFQDLRESLGISRTNESEFKFDTLHLLGLGDMTAEDVVEYFASYAPEGIEWIDNNSCNVVWLDSLSAARALHFKSKLVRGMPAREPKETFPKEFLDDTEVVEEETGQSILLKDKNREVELQDEIGEVILPKKKKYPQNSVDISEITVPIPPGYWRLGEPHPKTKCLLVRFGKVIDKLPFKSEKCNKYYKKLPSQSYRSVISETKKKELRSIFERNKELDQSKNPWGSLAQNWDKDARYREREPIMYNQKNEEEDEVQIVGVKNPKLMARLGTKRKIEPEGEKSDNEGNEGKEKTQRVILGRKTTKVPRMKMYADEEEENQKRRKILMKIKKQAEEIDRKESERDLRNMLGPSDRFLIKKDFPDPEATIDLASKLKNRNKRMIFAVESEPIPYGPYLADRDPRLLYPDARGELMERSSRKESDVTRTIFINPKRDIRERLEGGHSSRERTHSRRTSRRSPEMTLHSDRIRSSRSEHYRRRRRSYSPDRKRSDKHKTRESAASRAPKKPAVASTIWSKVTKTSASERSSSESESSDSESSSSEESSSSSKSRSASDNESDSSTGSSGKRIAARNPDRPGFDKSRLSRKVDHKSPLKITTTNEHFKQRRLRK